MSGAYEYRHAIGLEETNALGNAYFTAYLSWQGRCREMFLREEAPEILDLFEEGFRLVTTHVSCDFYAELGPRDEVVIRMSLRELTARTISVRFDYLRASPDPERSRKPAERERSREPTAADRGASSGGTEAAGEGHAEVVARGEQEIACMRLAEDGELVATAVPEPLGRALEPYR